MIGIETKVSGNDISAKVRVHTPIQGPVPANLVASKNPRSHDIYSKWKKGGKKYAVFKDSSVTDLSCIGYGYGIVDGNDIHIYRIDIDEDFRGSGYGLALMQALLMVGIKSGATADGKVMLVADARESDELKLDKQALNEKSVDLTIRTKQLSKYYKRMSFCKNVEDSETDYVWQRPMWAQIGAVITNIQVWRSAKYKHCPVWFWQFL
ncbi:GNAT family N-acetyltransferase [Chitinivorax sp. B]|uniref:GNAT family N-acetyltransferase n=1 Tax=Chitinivorax sp. B TaxID=2502235 RepID=UPI0010F7A7FE|nr:GNAT family N-acetyltransferase [Chitinivorax sp. B]